MKNLPIDLFKSPEFGNITVIEIKGEPWFIGKEVAGALGYKDERHAVKAHCKYMKILKRGVTPLLDIPSRGWQIINKKDLFRLIMKSELPSAGAFQDWVFDVVLPSIDKTGSYKIDDEILDPTPEKKFITPETVIAMRAAKDMAEIFGLKDNQALLSANRAIVNTYEIDCMAVLEIKGLVIKDQIQYFIPTVLGKDLHISARQFNKKLEEFGLQTKKRGYNNKLVWTLTEKGKPHAQLVDIGKKHKPDGKPIMQIQWAESVLEFFSDNPIENARMVK